MSLSAHIIEVGEHKTLGIDSRHKSHIIIAQILVLVLLLGFSSCKKMDDINAGSDTFETVVNNLQSTVKSLQNAYNQGKIVKSVTPLSDMESGGWLIVFSDDSRIKVINGTDGKNGTPHTTNPSRIITSIKQDDVTHTITIILADGSVFTFNKLFISPASISILDTNSICLTTGNHASIDFCVSPSNAFFHISGDNCQIELEKVGTSSVQTSSSYVTKPANYRLVGIEPVYDGETNEMIVGQYRAYIEDTQVSAEYDEMAALVLNVNDANGNPIQISTSAFRVIGKNFENLVKTGLPVIVINTPNSTPVKSKENYITGSMISVINSDMTFDLQGEMKIKGRGNTTWGKFPKKPYKIKFDKKQSILGEAKDKEWVLVANYSDKTQLRNALAFFMGQNSNLDYTSSYHFVELILNGEHKGSYMLAEQPKIGKNRVNVGDDGFLLEVDAKADSTDITFSTAHMKSKSPFNIKDPEVLRGDDAYNYVVNYVTVADSVLYSSNFADPEQGYRKYIDDDSFVEWYLINEIARNNDATMVTSCYMNLSRSGKLKMGPIWDFDIAFGNVNINSNWKTEGFWIKKAPWISRMFQDPLFVNKVKSRMSYYYDNKQMWLNQIDSLASYLDKSQQANEEIWHTMTVDVWPNYVVCGSYEAEVTRLKQWFSDRLDWLQTNIQALP